MRWLLAFLAGVLCGAVVVVAVLWQAPPDAAEAPARPEAPALPEPTGGSTVTGAPPPAPGPSSGPPRPGDPPEAGVPRRPGAQGDGRPADLPADPLIPPLRIPVDGVTASALVDTWGQARGGGREHDAIDIPAPRGTPVRAVADGHVEKLFDSVPGGLTIYQFDSAGALAFYYAHLDRYADGLAEGDAVRQGDLLGYVGSSGNAADDAPHLHFSVFVLGPERDWWRGEAVNPYPLLRGEASE